MKQFSDERILEDLMTSYHLILEKTFNLGCVYLANQQAVGGFPDKWNYTEKDYDILLIDLKKNNIVAIICCADNIEIFPKDFTYLHFPLADTEYDITKYFKPNYDFIEEHRIKGNIIIHCNAGCSRSASMLISYMMIKYNLRFEEALNRVRNIRTCVNVSNFDKYLKKFENNH